jgi:hypothetical protein
MDDKAAFGFYPQLKPKRTTQDPEAAKNAPIDFLRGRVAGTLGMPGDIEQLARDLAMLAGASESRSFLPTTERVLPNIPLGSNTPVSRAAAGLGSLTSNPFDVVKAGKLAGKAAKAAKPEVGQALEEYMFKQGLALPATVYHGSPHKFEKFDSSKIGTGEGAQAYGHGIYVAESPEVASAYKNAGIGNIDWQRATYGGKKIQSLYDAAQKAQDAAYRIKDPALSKAAISKANAELYYWESLLTGTHPYVAKSNALAEEGWPEMQAFVKSIDNKKFKNIDFPDTSLYKVDLPDEKIAKMLDWDKPLSQQPANIQKWLKDPYNPYRKQLTALDVGGNEPSGNLIMNRLQQLMSEGKKSDAFTNAANYGAANASRELADYGIPGIRYLDADSRAAGQGTSNFVVFPGEEDALTILERNQQPIKKESTPPTEMANGGDVNLDAIYMAVNDAKFRRK